MNGFKTRHAQTCSGPDEEPDDIDTTASDEEDDGDFDILWPTPPRNTPLAIKHPHNTTNKRKYAEYLLYDKPADTEEELFARLKSYEKRIAKLA
jgi:hypothetical protein